MLVRGGKVESLGEEEYSLLMSFGHYQLQLTSDIAKVGVIDGWYSIIVASRRLWSCLNAGLDQMMLI